MKKRTKINDVTIEFDDGDSSTDDIVELDGECAIEGRKVHIEFIKRLAKAEGYKLVKEN